MIKVQTLIQCKYFNCKAHLPISEVKDCQSDEYTGNIPCPICEGSSNPSQWINLVDLSHHTAEAIEKTEESTIPLAGRMR